ncbi:MAG TPA: alpha/beta hydrolase [Actinomycetota bacterium]|nr:alpha/beta hydrolase [Actinomycetota bacterium]
MDIGIESTTIEAGGLFWDVGTMGDPGSEPVLLLHGFPERWQTWALMMPALAEAGGRVHAACLPGYGETTPPTTYDIDVVAEHVAALCHEIGGGGSCHLIGHDWGGIIAAAVASLHPDAVRSVTLACCAHPAALRSALNPAQMLKSWYVGAFQIPGIEHVLGNAAYLDRFAGGNGQTGIHGSDEMARALGYYRANLAPWKLGSSRAGRISQPGLVIHAAHDAAVTEALMRESAEHLDDLRSFEVMDSGHFVHRERPSDLSALILGFLRDVAS